MKLRYNQSKGNRINSQMHGFESVNCEWLWNKELKKWAKNIETGKYSYSSHCPCKSVKSFRRKLKAAPKDVEFRLWNKYVGYNVFGFGFGKEV